MSIRRIAVVFVVLQGVCCAVASADSAVIPRESKNDATTKPARVKSESDILADQLVSTDASVQQAAVDRIKTLLSAPFEVDDDGRRVPSKVRFNVRWVTALMRTKRFDDVEAIATQGIILSASDSKTVAMLQKARANAFLAAGKADPALSAAKAYYNVCGMTEIATKREGQTGTGSLVWDHVQEV